MNDDRLHHAFNELRRVEAGRVPPFHRLWRARKRSSLLASLAFTIVLITIVVIAVVPIARRRHTPQPSISAWRAPTDFLLKTPGKELLESVPNLRGNLQ